MNGNNELRICFGEAVVAFQEYLNKRWTEDTPEISSIEVDTMRGNSLILKLKDKTEDA